MNGGGHPRTPPDAGRYRTAVDAEVIEVLREFWHQIRDDPEAWAGFKRVTCRVLGVFVVLAAGVWMVTAALMIAASR